METSSLSSLLHLQGLPPLPRSLTGYPSSSNKVLQQGSPQNYGNKRPVPPPRPHSRRSSSSGSSFRASPEQIVGGRSIVNAPPPPPPPEPMRSSPRSLSSSPHSPHIDSGIGRSSADSFSEPQMMPTRAFVRVVKSPTGMTSSSGGSKLDAQLSQLRRDMQQLRQQDMALLGHLLQINQGIQDLKNALVPPPQPAPSSIHLMYNPSYYSNPPPPSRTRKLSHQMSKGARMFARRSAGGMSSEGELALASLGAVGGYARDEEDDDGSDSVSSLEFGDV